MRNSITALAVRVITGAAAACEIGNSAGLALHRRMCPVRSHVRPGVRIGAAVVTTLLLAFQTDVPAHAELRSAPEVVQVVVPELNEFWSQSLDGFVPPRVVVYNQRGRSPNFRSGCGLVDTSEPNAFYCRADTTVYLDLEFLDQLLREYGDMAPVTVIAHEYGHAVQDQAGIYDLGLLTIQLELQADCFAGLFANYAATQGYLETGDVREALEGESAAGDAQGVSPRDPGAHGNAEQRMEWFARGVVTGSAAACQTWQ